MLSNSLNKSKLHFLPTGATDEHHWSGESNLAETGKRLVSGLKVFKPQEPLHILYYLESCWRAGMVSQACQPAAALNREITALLQAVAATGLVQKPQIFGHTVQLFLSWTEWNLASPSTLRERKCDTQKFRILLLEVLYLDRFLVEEFNDFLSGRWMAALQVAQYHFLSARFSEAW